MLETRHQKSCAQDYPKTSALDFTLFQDKIETVLKNNSLYRARGKVIEVIGTLVKARVPNVEIGEICQLLSPEQENMAQAEIIGFLGNEAILSVYGNVMGISTRTEILPTGMTQEIGVGDQLLGRVIDSMGRALDRDERGDLHFHQFYPLYQNAPNPLDRRLIKEKLSCGVRAIDGLLTCGEGQRMGIFAAAGGGKSTLLSSITLGTDADVIVIALIGERGREVREFIENHLGAQAMKKAVIVVATSDRSSMERARAAYVATAIAEYFRDQKRKTLLLMDSITRFGRALREIGLAAGEPPTRGGFPPSVFATLPRLMERAGMNKNGSITAFYTILVEGDDMTEPIADESRSILDGHIILSRALASKGQYPAIDILHSASRVMRQIASAHHQQLASEIRALLASYQEVEFLVQIGEYKKGNDKKSDRAIELIDGIRSFLKQDSKHVSAFEETLTMMDEICQQ